MDVSVVVCACLCESICVDGLLTRVRSCPFAVISSSPGNSGMRPCGGDDNGLDDIYGVGLGVEVRGEVK